MEEEPTLQERVSEVMSKFTHTNLGGNICFFKIDNIEVCIQDCHGNLSSRYLSEKEKDFIGIAYDIGHLITDLAERNRELEGSKE